MAKARKIEWTVAARIDLLEILEFYAKRNGNSVYSRKIHLLIKKTIQLLSKRSFLGKATEIENIRVIVVKDYLIFYEALEKSVLIHTIWACERNPEDLTILRK